ncbi:hypothetical protein ACOSP7_024593 [Xanthoceras sorbifolium]
MVKSLQTIFLLLILSFGTLSYSLPLSTSKKWIIDSASGHRVKLTCVNWAAHLEPMVAEGLDRKPLRDIVAKVAEHHFNCVRLTWATFLFTRYAQRTVTESLDSLGLREAKDGIAKNNPVILNMTLIQAYETVVDELGAQGLMVVLDNHVSNPNWCCPYNDGNGFFGDADFHPREWLHGLITVGKRFKTKNQVVAMSIRNELRGSRQNEHDWYRYIGRGARMVHKANPDVLVIVSGLTWGTDLSFLRQKSLGLDLNNKLVYETHWYSFSGDQQIWEVQPLNRVCAKSTQSLINNSGFLTSGRNPVPLFLSEFGFDQRGQNRADNRFSSCFMAYAAEKDLDWGLWALQGSYYLREGHTRAEETFGILDINWDHLRNPKFLKRLRFMQRMIQDPNSNLSTSYILYHPESGNCVGANGKNKIYTSNSRRWSRWSHDGDGAPIRLMGSALCLKVAGDGLPPVLSSDCLSQQSAWKSVSNSKLHLAAKDQHGEYLCLDKISAKSSKILTRKCICIDDDSDCLENPQSQWFKFISTNVK